MFFVPLDTPQDEGEHRRCVRAPVVATTAERPLRRRGATRPGPGARSVDEAFGACAQLRVWILEFGPGTRGPGGVWVAEDLGTGNWNGAEERWNFILLGARTGRSSPFLIPMLPMLHQSMMECDGLTWPF